MGQVETLKHGEMWCVRDGTKGTKCAMRTVYHRIQAQSMGYDRIALVLQSEREEKRSVFQEINGLRFLVSV